MATDAITNMTRPPIWPLVIIVPLWGITLIAFGPIALACVLLGFLSAVLCLLAVQRHDQARAPWEGPPAHEAPNPDPRSTCCGALIVKHGSTFGDLTSECSACQQLNPEVAPVCELCGGTERVYRSVAGEGGYYESCPRCVASSPA